MEINQSYTVSVVETANPEDIRFVRERMREYNESLVGPDNRCPLAVFLHKADHVIIGGLLGSTYWGWLHIDILWIEENLRRQGYGRTLLCAAEEEAVKRGCTYAHIETHSFQALSFYENQEYRVCGQLKDLPFGHTKYLLRKTLKSITT